jgi:hypothetical protein
MQHTLESQIKSVTLVRYQAPQLRASLLALSEDPDVGTKDRSDAKNLFDVLGSFEFIFGMVIWHGILFVVNKVRKNCNHRLCALILPYDR